MQCKIFEYNFTSEFLKFFVFYVMFTLSLFVRKNICSYAQSVLCVSTDLTGLNVVGSQLQYNYIDIFDYNAPEAFTPVDLYNVATVWQRGRGV
jgi:hypothetical protein